MTESISNFLNGLSSVASSNAQSGLFGKASDVLSNATTPEKAKIAAKEFESVFIGQLLQFMVDTVPVDENFGGGFAEETYRSFVSDQYGSIISKAGGIGISDAIQKSLLSAQGISDGSYSKTLQGTTAYQRTYNNINGGDYGTI